MRDYDKYPVLGRPASTLHEHHRVDRRGAASYPEWIRDRIWEMLQRPACGRFFEPEGSYTQSGGRSVYEWIEEMQQWVKLGHHVRVELLDGTVIKEWPAKTSQS